MNYDKHVWIAEAFFNETEVKEILAAASKLEWHGGRVGGQGFDPDGEELEGGAEVSDIRMSQVKWMEDRHLSQKFHEKLATAIQHASVENNWLWEFSHFENFQFTNYTNRPHLGGGDFYTWHTDSGPTGTIHDEKHGMIRKLSVTIQLSDPDDYEGGNVQLLDEAGNSYIAPRKRGCIVLFDSRTQHRVLKVTKGTRRSIVGWTVGPRWK